METKTSQAIALLKAMKVREALRIFKTFRAGFSKEEHRTIEIAYECMTGKASFYMLLGICPETVCREAIAIITTKYSI